MHEELEKVGLRFEKKGSGAIVWVGDIAVKASSIDRKFSMGKLCKKLGDFVAGNYPKELEKYTPEPVRTVNISEWKKYQKECVHTANENADLILGSASKVKVCPL